MHLQKCENGHFYDGDKFASCPHCSNTGGDKKTVPSNGGGTQGSNFEVTVPASGLVGTVAPSGGGYSGTGHPDPGPGSSQGGFSSKPTEPADIFGGRKFEDDDEAVTMRFHASKVVGWLVAVDGPSRGDSFTLKTGKNFIGRKYENDIVLEGDDSVSRHKHAIIIYEPKKRLFIAEQGESSSLFYVNDDVVLSPVELKNRDLIAIGNWKLIFVPFCDEAFGWDDVGEE